MNRKDKKVEITSQSIKKWKEQKEQSKRNNIPSEADEPHKPVFPEVVESIAKDLNLKLNIQTVEKIALQHPALATSNAFLEVLKQFSMAVKPHFKSNNHQQLTELFTVYINEIERTMLQLVKERKGVVASLEPACVRDNPQDNTQKEKSWHYNISIRDKEEEYQRKRLFKDFYDQNLKENKQALDAYIASSSSKINEDVVNQCLIPYQVRKVEEVTKQISDSERKYHKQLINLFKTAAESNQVQRERVKAVRKKKVQQALREREELCQKMNSSLGYFISLNDLFSYK